MDLLLIFGIVLLYSFQTLFCKLFTDRYPGKTELASPVFCILEAVAIVLFTWAWVGFKFELSWGTLLIGLGNAGALWLYNTSLIKAGRLGSYAFMNVMMLFGGILLPILYSIIFLGEGITTLQIIGVVVMLGACVLMNLNDIGKKEKDSNAKKTPLAYFIFCGLLFLANGIYGVFLKAQTEYNANQSNEMIMITFGVMGVIGLVQLIAQEKKGTISAFKLNLKCSIPLVVCLLSAALAINCVMMIIPLVDTAVFYTLDNGGVLMMSAVYAVLLFKEKATVNNIFGVLLAVASMVLLSIPA